MNKEKVLRYSTDCFSAGWRIAMTDHNLGDEGGEKEAGHPSLIMAEIVARLLLSTPTLSTAHRHCEEERRSNLLIID